MGYIIVTVLSFLTVAAIAIGFQKILRKEMAAGYMVLIFVASVVGWIYIFAKIDSTRWLFDTDGQKIECKQSGPLATDC